MKPDFRVIWSTLLFCVWTGLAQAEPDNIDLELSYTGEGVSNISGGIKQGYLYHGAGDLTLGLDTERAHWWSGGYCFLEVLLNHGANPSQYIGDTQTASNIADKNRTRLQQLWFEQQFGQHASLLFGLHDLNSEFYVSEYGSLFLNSSFGIGPDISTNAATSLWPEAGLTIRAAWHGKHLYAQLAAYDGDPATRALRAGSEGIMWIAETGIHRGESAYKLGLWHHTAPKSAPDGRIFSSNSGLYAVADQPLNNNAGIFLQLGIARPDRNDIASYLGLGIHIHGLIPTRDNDAFGIALARAGFSRINRQVNILAAAETSLEITYDMAMTDWLSIHPSFQWIRHPGGDMTLKAPQVAMLRIELRLL